MVDTSSYAASSFSTRATRTLARASLRSMVAPNVCSRRIIVRTSCKSGRLGKTSGSAVSSAAASAGSAAFFAALTLTVPLSGMPPSISSRAGIAHPLPSSIDGKNAAMNRSTPTKSHRVEIFESPAARMRPAVSGI